MVLWGIRPRPLGSSSGWHPCTSADPLLFSYRPQIFYPYDLPSPDSVSAWDHDCFHRIQSFSAWSLNSPLYFGSCVPEVHPCSSYELGSTLAEPQFPFREDVTCILANGEDWEAVVVVIRVLFTLLSYGCAELGYPYENLEVKEIFKGSPLEQASTSMKQVNKIFHFK